MRRVCASLLMLIFSLPLIAPALASTPDDSQLPACCRRGGKHHCAAALEVKVPLRYRVVQETCPLSPFANTPLLQPHAFALMNRLTADGFATGPAVPVRAADAGYRISADRTRHKRGPPRRVTL